jgi:hypothetical protein
MLLSILAIYFASGTGAPGSERTFDLVLLTQMAAAHKATPAVLLVLVNSKSMRNVTRNKFIKNATLNPAGWVGASRPAGNLVTYVVGGKIENSACPTVPSRNVEESENGPFKINWQ